jgi:hypothetical protein
MFAIAARMRLAAGKRIKKPAWRRAKRWRRKAGRRGRWRSCLTCGVWNWARCPQRGIVGDELAQLLFRGGRFAHRWRWQWALRKGGTLGPGHDGVAEARRFVERTAEELRRPGAGFGLVLGRSAAEVEAATEVFRDFRVAEAGDVLELGGGGPGVRTGTAHGGRIPPGVGQLRGPLARLGKRCSVRRRCVSWRRGLGLLLVAGGTGASRGRPFGLSRVGCRRHGAGPLRIRSRRDTLGV